MPLLAIAFIGFVGLASFPQITFAETTGYVLEEPSDFQDGCQDGCACPIVVLPLRGTFCLTPAGQGRDFKVFDVRDVSWVIANDVLGDTFVVGSGTFRILSGADPLQRLELDLVIGEQAPVHFDSGLVPAAAEFPEIEVSIAMNDFFCYDNVFSVHARPDESITVQATNWGRIKSLYKR
jgi:hypothetical protein